MKVIVSQIERLKGMAILQIFTVYLRYLVGSAFIISAIGMGKLSNRAVIFSSEKVSIEQLSPIAQFFRVMSESGLYWNFIGWMQIFCGILLVTQKFAKTGAIIFFGIILNIFIITISYHFSGTVWITGLMLLSGAFLLAWDLNSFQFIMLKPTSSNLVVPATPFWADNPFWIWLGLLIVISMMSLGLSKVGTGVQLILGVTEGFLGLIFFFLKDKYLK